MSSGNTWPQKGNECGLKKAKSSGKGGNSQRDWKYAIPGWSPGDEVILDKTRAQPTCGLLGQVRLGDDEVKAELI